MLNDQQTQEIELYGKVLSGDESDLDRAKLSRIQYLKKKFRPSLQAAIGDYGDNITDTVRALVLGQAIQLGVVTDQEQIQQYQAYITAMLDGYGGPDAILSVLLGSMTGLQAELVGKYYLAKSSILTSWSIEEIDSIDLPGEPISEVNNV